MAKGLIVIFRPQPCRRYRWESASHGTVTVIMTDEKRYAIFESTIRPGEDILKTREGLPGTREVIIESGRFAGQNAFVSLRELYELSEN